MSELTAVKVLSRMKPGCAYALWELSSLVGWQVVTARPVIQKMEKDGVLVSRVMPDRHRRFFIAGTENMKVERPSTNPNVATPLIPILMTGELTGWESAANKHRDLCMSIRRMA